MCALMSYTWPGRIFPPGGITSSPVVRIATRGFANTSTSAAPTAAIAPTLAGVRNSPAVTTTSLFRMSSPLRETFSPGWTGEYTRTASPSFSVSSTMTTESAPLGSVEPVATSVAVPFETVFFGTESAYRVSIRVSSAGVNFRARYVSEARTA